MNTLLTRDLYNNPTELQMVILDQVQEKLLNGNGVISDSNSPFIFLLEAACSLAAGAIEQISNEFPSIHINRAQTMEDLYKNLSDYDYIEMFASPAATSVSIMLDKKQLIEKSKVLASSNGEYLMMQLPKDIEISFGGYVFGMYYPLNILISRETNLVSINYDTSVLNPLNQIAYNDIEFIEYKYGLIDIIEINLPVYQFQTKTEIIDCSKVSGLNQKLQYTNKLYAIRVFHKKDNEWFEMNIVYSETTYDADSASVIVKVSPDTKTCQLIIPQIYFEKRMMGSKLKVEMFTTLGFIDIDISNVDNSQIKVTIPSQTENIWKDYAEVFNKLETFIVHPHKAVITGGTNEADFKTIKKRIQNRISINGLLVSPGQLQTHYSDLGYSIEHIKDSFEERTYAACGLLTDFDAVPLQAGMFVTEVPLVIPDYMKKHVVESDDAVTILPTAIFRYDTSLNRATFITAEEEAMIDTLYQTDLSLFCRYLNDNNFTKNIFHSHLRKRNKTPFLTNYDLSRPAVSSLKFIKENIRTSEQMVIHNYTVTHNCFEPFSYTKPHQYKILVTTKCTPGVKELLLLDDSDVRLLVNLTSVNEIELYQVANYIKDENLAKEDKFLFEIVITPTYEFDSFGNIGIKVLNQDINLSTGYFTSEYVTKAFVKLESQLNLTFLVKYAGITDQILSEKAQVLGIEYKQLTQQEMNVTLGYNLHNKLYSSVDLVYYRTENTVDGDDNYVITETVYEQYPEDVYKRDPIDESLIVAITTGLIDEGSVVAPTLTVIDNLVTGKIESSQFTIVIGDNVESIQAPYLQVTDNSIMGQVVSSSFSNSYKGFSQVQAPALHMLSNDINGTVYSSPFSVIHGCIGVIKTPELFITDKTVTGEITSSEFLCDVVCEITDIGIEKEHNEGDFILDENGDKIVKYDAGSIALSLNGEAKMHPREIMFMTNILQVSLNLYYADIINTNTIFRNICDRVYSQFSILASSANRLLENTYVVYKPYTSMGRGEFYANANNIITHDLGISLKFRCYIPEYSLTDVKLQKLIRVKLIEIVEAMLSAGKLSVTEAADKIKLNFPDIIKHVDVFGINGNINLQLLETVDKAKRPIIKQELWLDESKTVVLNKAIIVQFVS